MKADPPNGILETAIYAENLSEAERFYGDIVGLTKMAEVDGRHVFFRCGKGMLLVFKASETRKTYPDPLPIPVHGTEGFGHVCFSIDDRERLDIWVQLFDRKGIAIEADFEWPNGARSIYVRDPAGNSIEFAEPKLWGLA